MKHEAPLITYQEIKGWNLNAPITALDRVAWFHRNRIQGSIYGKSPEIELQHPAPRAAKPNFYSIPKKANRALARVTPNIFISTLWIKTSLSNVTQARSVTVLGTTTASRLTKPWWYQCYPNLKTCRRPICTELKSPDVLHERKC